MGEDEDARIMSAIMAYLQQLPAAKRQMASSMLGKFSGPSEAGGAEIIPEGQSRLGFKSMSPIQALQQHLAVVSGTGMDSQPGRTMTTERALQDQTSAAALGSMLSNPQDVGGLGQPGSQGSYSDANFWSTPNAYVPGLVSQERDYDKSLETARQRFYQEHGQPGSQAYTDYTHTHNADPKAAPGTDSYLPAWLSEDRQPVAPTYMRQRALDWRLNGGANAGQASFDPYSTP